VTDGAIRLIVLLHAKTLGFTPIQIALMFVMYELAGVFTNLFGGIAAVRYGLKTTLFVSLGFFFFFFLFSIYYYYYFFFFHLKAASSSACPCSSAWNTSLNSKTPRQSSLTLNPKP
jgi:predicted MFS family arabinose efflux permease